MHMVTIPVLLHLRCCEDEEPEACIFVTVRLKNLTMCVCIFVSVKMKNLKSVTKSVCCYCEDIKRDEVCILISVRMKNATKYLCFHKVGLEVVCLHCCEESSMTKCVPALV